MSEGENNTWPAQRLENAFAMKYTTTNSLPPARRRRRCHQQTCRTSSTATRTEYEQRMKDDPTLSILVSCWKMSGFGLLVLV